MFKKSNYIFIDESGKPEVYSAKGSNLVSAGSATKFLILASVKCDDQLKLQQQIMDFKSELLKKEDLKKIFSPVYSLDSFHANNDYPEVRKMFYDFIFSKLDVDINVLVAEKLKCYGWLQVHPGRLYGFMAGQLLKSICYQAEKTEIIFSRKDSKLKLRQELEVEVDRVRLNYLKDNGIGGDFTLTYQHNPHYTHGGLQVADYVSWAIFQFFERGNIEHYEIVKNKIGSIKDICNKKYFTQSNPLQLST